MTADALGRAAAVAITALATMRCGRVGGMHVPEPATHGGAAHVSWIIMSGDRDNPDQDFVCQSDPRSDCMITTTRVGAPVFAAVHIYYHPAPAEISYKGSVAVGFFEGAASEPQSHVASVGAIVKANGTPYHQSVTDIVTNNPGRYAMTVAVVATRTVGRSEEQIRDEVRVVVR